MDCHGLQLVVRPEPASRSDRNDTRADSRQDSRELAGNIPPTQPGTFPATGAGRGTYFLRPYPGSPSACPMSARAFTTVCPDNCGQPGKSSPRDVPNPPI